MSESVFQVITDRITQLLEKGVVPWHQPWKSSRQAPQNLVSGKLYRGVNVFLLNASGFASPYWLTFKQAAALGGHVKRGEKGFPVVFWRWLEVEDKDTGEKKTIPFLRFYSVFNVAQCEGIEIPSEVTFLSPEPPREHSPVEAAEAIVAGMPQRPEVKHGMDQAFYSPRADFVGMPAVEQFQTEADYYSVLFHELTHSTGHQTRLDRKWTTEANGKLPAFGSDRYAKEELVAEMGAAFLCGEAGIVERTIDQSAAYVANWLQRLKDDTKLVVQAAAQAQKAADFVLGRNQTTEPTEQ